MNHVILIFIDGMGIGERNEFNPLAQISNVFPLDNFVDSASTKLLGGVMAETDARLGVEGRPQSASGHTAIYTGKNAPQINGAHKHGFPNETLRALIKQFSVFKQLENSGFRENVFLNTYTPNFFSMRNRPRSATTVMVETTSLEFRKLPDLLGRRALFHDFTNRKLREHKFDVPEFSAFEAAEILVEVARMHHFTLYEYFLTDKIGHDMNWDAARIVLPELALFVQRTIELIDSTNTTLILTSDHGNIENLSIRNHTLNKVPTIVWGRNNHEI
ncbi:MAG: alkaline phosphatase family protein, partial [Pyrinomonadaceae bacterium]